MNKDQRKRLQEAVDLMEQAKDIISEVAGEEQEKFDNLNEGMQAMERNQKLEENAGFLTDSEDDLENVIQSVADVINNE